MRSKRFSLRLFLSLNWGRNHTSTVWLASLFLTLFTARTTSLYAQNTDTDASAASAFLGESSCASSGCHGGAGEKHDQTIRWKKLDVHTRSFATLTGARSARIADNLKISDPTVSSRCTVCHEPFQTIANTDALVKALDPASGVSCENCHGPAQKWLLGHTRPDWTHADRVHAGMRDLDNIYTRANSCVACHQNVDGDILKAGHPELIFELDGQSVTEPKHWREKPNWSGPQTWLVGQAVGLREMSWQLSRETVAGEHAEARTSAVLWLLESAAKGNDALPSASISGDVTPNNAAAAQKWADDFAKQAAASSWSAADARKCLEALAATGASFREPNVKHSTVARRAERLVLALDRLIAGLGDPDTSKRLDAPLNQLFKDAQSIPDFKPQVFAGHLDDFQQTLVGK
ncbi:MAG TPA: multiheme c-type cytochrome [Verrucomicrobiae bacterium]|nr:multiheme c-type cytochrome [Verrucomicrobiae bacterium]